MEPLTVSEIRSKFLEFFQKNGHTVVASSSLLPTGDPSLLFTTAGMVQFKPLFTGAVDLPYTRATSAQKCLRTTDLENVGKTERHCTFFEMLGNFSFGDYFKKEAIGYALEFSTKDLGFPFDKIWITVFENDDEAIELWKNLGVPQERITRLGKKDNFWGPAGDSGACGPCSELYLDRGVEKGFSHCSNENPSCRPGCDCDRFLEFWNLVFNQFNQTTAGEFLPLKQTGIDTGAGVERIALLSQGVDSVYDTDEFQKIIQAIEQISQKKYEKPTQQAFRVIADHIRSIVFALGDGIYPDKVGRGYVIRRLIRRAYFFGNRLGIQSEFLHELVPPVLKIYSGRYPELSTKAAQIQSILLGEEKLFLHTLETGIEVLEKSILELEKSSQKVFPGSLGFKLYGTYGFPVEMTKEIVLDRGFEFDEEGYHKELEKDKEQSRETWKGKKLEIFVGTESPTTEFLGYTNTKATGKLLKIYSNQSFQDKLSGDADAILVFDKTPFYAESGGQVGDIGYVQSSGALFQVLDTQKEGNSYLHIGKLLKGALSLGDTLELEVDEQRRNLIKSNHSSTHLLNGALRDILGTHVAQKASLVSPEYLRFDFSHPKALTNEDLQKIEDRVNQAIADQVVVNTKVQTLAEAKSTGALSFFEDKYGDIVRTIQMGSYSFEFCGGTHVSNTKDISKFLIVKESSPGAGNRRIEAVTGDFVVRYYQTVFQELEEKIREYQLELKDLGISSESLKWTLEYPSPVDIESILREKGSIALRDFRAKKLEVEKILEEKKSALLKEKKKLSKESFSENKDLVQELMDSGTTIGKFFVVVKEFEGVDPSALKELGDSLRGRAQNLIALFATKTDSAATLVFLSHPNVPKLGFHAGNLLKEALVHLAGKGGGKPDLAQGGGQNTAGISQALLETLEKIRNLS